MCLLSFYLFFLQIFYIFCRSFSFMFNNQNFPYISFVNPIFQISLYYLLKGLDLFLYLEVYVLLVSCGSLNSDLFLWCSVYQFETKSLFFSLGFSSFSFLHLLHIPLRICRPSSEELSLE